MQNIISYLEKLTPFALIPTIYLMIPLLGFIDFLTGMEISFSIFYLIPISTAAWFVGKRAGIYASFISALTWFIADICTGHIYSSEWILLWNTIMRFLLFIIISITLSNLKLYIHKHFHDELQLQKNKNIIESSQKITSLIAGNITMQNAEIIKWINRKQEKGQAVPEVIQNASRIIGKSLQLLTEISFVHPYSPDHSISADNFLDLLENNLSKVREEYPGDSHNMPLHG